jgi:hypothetical protein
MAMTKTRGQEVAEECLFLSRDSRDIVLNAARAKTSASGWAAFLLDTLPPNHPSNSNEEKIKRAREALASLIDVERADAIAGINQ